MSEESPGMVLLRAVEALQKQLLEEVREFRKEAKEGREVRARLDTRRKADSERQARWRSRNVSHGDNNVISPVVDLDLKLGVQEQDLKGHGRRDANVSHVRLDTGPTRQAFEAAYRVRYGIGPTWNKTTNSQMARFVERIGVQDAPLVAEFYIGHNAAEYVKKMHPAGRLLNDAEALHAQWQTGRKITGTEARRADETQAKSDVFSKFLTGGANAVGTK